MAVEYWKAKKDIMDAVLALVGQNHPDLALVSSEIVVVFREKASKAGGTVVLGASKKATALANALANADYKFILELAADQWEELDSTKREALLDHLLCGCRVEEDPKSGKVKYFIAKPDVMAYHDNVERYGMWFPRGEDDDAGPSPVDEVFGEDEE